MHFASAAKLLADNKFITTEKKRVYSLLERNNLFQIRAKFFQEISVASKYYRLVNFLANFHAVHIITGNICYDGTKYAVSANFFP